MKPVSALILVIASLALAAPASAVTTVAGNGEPRYTAAFGGNTHWVNWQAPEGATEYRMWARYRRENIEIGESYTTPTRAASGTQSFSWAGVANLEHNRRYTICVQGQYRVGTGNWFSSGPNSCEGPKGDRATTTVDLTAPTAELTVAGGARYAGNSIPLRLDFTSDVAGPYPATYICIQWDDPYDGERPQDVCRNSYVLSPGCSNPLGQGKSTSFECALTPTNVPDGPVAVCAYAAEAAVVDNPNGPDQHLQADQANRTEAKCAELSIDRVAPTVETTASKTTALTGEAVSFSSEASDGSSGLADDSARWDFGDGSATVAGGSASHAFAKPGTYTVKFRIRDAVGNEAVAERTITVEAPPAPPVQPDPKPDPQPQPGPGPGPQPEPQPEPGSGPQPEPGPGPQPEPQPEPAIDEKAISDAAGGGPLLRTELPDLTVVAPKKFRLGKSKSLAVGVRTTRAGQLTLSLVRGKKVVARLAVGLSPGSTTQRIRLPKGMKPGTHSLKIAFKPNGAKWSATGAVKIAFAKAKR